MKALVHQTLIHPSRHAYTIYLHPISYFPHLKQGGSNRISFKHWLLYHSINSNYVMNLTASLFCSIHQGRTSSLYIQNFQLVMISLTGSMADTFSHSTWTHRWVFCDKRVVARVLFLHTNTTSSTPT